MSLRLRLLLSNVPPLMFIVTKFIPSLSVHLFSRFKRAVLSEEYKVLSCLGDCLFHGRYYIGFLIFCQEIFSVGHKIKYILVSEKVNESTILIG